MEDILAAGLILLFAIGVLQIVVGMLKAIGNFFSPSSRYKTANSSPSSGRQIQHISEFSVRIKNSRLKEGDENSPIIKSIQAEGLLPISSEFNDLAVMISVFDKTSGKLEPVLSAMDTFQEPDTPVYRCVRRLGHIKPGQGFIKWVELGVIIPEIIEPPYGGRRNMVACVRLFDLSHPPDVEHGFGIENDPNTIWQKTIEFTHDFDEKGYLEASEHRDESVGIAIQIGIAVAMADGNLDDSEGIVIRNWVSKAVEPFNYDKQQHLKDTFNSAIKEAYKKAISGTLSLSDLTHRLNEIGEKSTKYDAIELCFEVMAADGVADAEELKVISNVAKALGLDMDEVSKMRDQKIVSLNANLSGQSSIEQLLGIDESWSKEKIKKHLRTEFQKWNNRHSTLPDGEERENAQRMLDRIAEARKKYA